MPPETSALSPELRRRVVIENILPRVEGAFPVKRCVGDTVVINATIHADGSDRIAAIVRHRLSTSAAWSELPLELINPGKDLWECLFPVTVLGLHEFTLEGWIDGFATWQVKLLKKAGAGQDVEQDLQEGVAFLHRAQANAKKKTDSAALHKAEAVLAATGAFPARVAAATDPALSQLMGRLGDRGAITTTPVFKLRVERSLARSSAWYEMFPRSAGATDQRPATLREAEARLPYVAGMGFDILYLPPVHPIGKSFRKGPNNNPNAQANDPGSPWAIGGAAGGHKAVDPALGTLEDFSHFVTAAQSAGLEVALDLAYQCSPDHPYVREHPEWFHHRPDGSIQYAENPPKKYEDIYPLDFECAEWEALWNELKSVVLFWIAQGVRIFRVDNPHTKPFRFWEWLIAEIQAVHPDTLFLAEAFTRPAGMQLLAKAGFSQSYTYFTWRTTKAELTEYLTELTQPPVADVLRPNFFINTPDILHAFLQTGGLPAFRLRLILAATLSASYGIYGPAYELGEAAAIPGTEDYLDSEKYQIRTWDIERPESLRPLITTVNRIRHANSALQLNANLRFYPVDNPMIIAYGKSADSGENQIVTLVNLDPSNVQSGWVQIPRGELGLPDPYQVEDLLTGQVYTWHGDANFVSLNPAQQPGHILKVFRATP